MTRTLSLGHLERLFHGTLETLEGPMRPGGYDGVLWTAETSAIAQSYIPATGGSTYAGVSAFELEQKVRPSRTDPFYTLACQIGPPARDVEWDDFDRARSWGIPEGYATNRDVVRHIEDVLGYERRGKLDFTYKLLTDGWNAETGHKIVPAGYKRPGTLVMFDGFQQMRIADISTGESDQTALQYHRVALFRRLEAEGFDGVAIDDFCQSKTWGNVGHRSIGFFAGAAARLECTRIPAVNFDWGPTAAELSVTETPEFRAWVADQQAQRARQSMRARAPA